jgi:FO synthase
MLTTVDLNPAKKVDLHWNDISMEQAWRQASPVVARLLEQTMAGMPLSAEEAVLLAQADGADLIAVLKTADDLRQQVAGDRITYVVNRNINFTNICIVGCRFCGFGRAPKAEGAYFLPLDEIVARAVQAQERGATELCIQGGLPRDMDGYHYRNILLAIKAELPDMHIHAFSPMEIIYGVEKTGLPLREYLLMLKEAGLGSIPGTAAEVLDNDIRRLLSQNKLKVHQWVEVIKTAHQVGIPTTSTLMYGHIEEPRHWIRHMLLLREIQAETGGFTEFVPLAFIYEKTRLFQSGKGRAGSSLREDLLVHALARLFFNGSIPNIQVSWVKLGFEVSIACLQAGGNDFGGTLMEESISKSAGATFGEYVSPEEFQAMIRNAGRVPAERTTTYKLRRVFSSRDSEAAIRVRPQPMPAGHRHYSGTGY